QVRYPARTVAPPPDAGAAAGAAPWARADGAPVASATANPSAITIPCAFEFIFSSVYAEAFRSGWPDPWKTPHVGVPSRRCKLAYLLLQMQYGPSEFEQGYLSLDYDLLMQHHPAVFAEAKTPGESND